MLHPDISAQEIVQTDGDWVEFLFSLGKYLEELRMEKRRVDTILVVPAVDFISSIITAGAVAHHSTNQLKDTVGSSRFKDLIGAAVNFPKMVTGRNGVVKSKKFGGTIEEICFTENGEQMLKIKYEDRVRSKQGTWIKCYANIREADWPLVTLAEQPVDIGRVQHGTELVAGVAALQHLLGESLSHFLAVADRLSWIIDTKARVIQELSAPIPLHRFTRNEAPHELLLRDLIRPDLARWPAMKGSFRTHIDDNLPDTGDWKFSIIVGALPVMRLFERAQSQVRVGVISSVMPSFNESVTEAGRLFRRRGERDVVIPDRLLAAKPASFDIQIWEPA